MLSQLFLFAAVLFSLVNQGVTATLNLWIIVSLVMAVVWIFVAVGGFFVQFKGDYLVSTAGIVLCVLSFCQLVWMISLGENQTLQNMTITPGELLLGLHKVWLYLSYIFAIGSLLVGALFKYLASSKNNYGAIATGIWYIFPVSFATYILLLVFGYFLVPFATGMAFNIHALGFGYHHF